MRLIDADALIEKAKFEAQAMPEPWKSSFAVYVEWLVNKTPTATDCGKRRWGDQ